MYQKLCFGLTFYLCWWIDSTRSQVVNTTIGRIEGKSQPLSNVIEYLGVPYAEPPTGQYRFQPPLKKKPFANSTEPFNAKYHKSPCQQDKDALELHLANSATTDDEGIILQFLHERISEDCLFLNIYTPVSSDQTDKLPVMVFLHGGEFIGGTGSAYKGKNLAEQHEVVVVTMNYRLGVFGFLSDSTNSFLGNIGLLDQQMALLWIQENINAFGGNSSSITLFGEEAGGSAVHIHTLNAENDPIFHSAIVQSAQYNDGVLSKEQCKDQFQEFVSLLGLSATDPDLLLKLQQMNATEIFAASQMIETWRPCIDHNLIHDFPQKTIQKNNFNNKVNLLIGTNSEVISNTNYDVTSNEWLYNVTNKIVTSSFPQLYQNITEKSIKRMEKNYLQFFSIKPKSQMTAEERQAFIGRTFSDQLYKTWVQEVSWETSAKSSFSVFNYLFTGTSIIDASLSSELPLIFGYDTSTENQDSQEQMMTFWTNFAKTGNPNFPSSTVSWPEYVTYDGDSCRRTLDLPALDSSNGTNDAVSRSWEFWLGYFDLLEMSCINTTEEEEDSTVNEDDCNPEIAEACPPSVKDAIGMNVTNEEAAIMLIVFICLTALFLVVALITSVFCCLYKKRLKRMKKKNKKAHGGHDNPTMSEYKL